MFQVKKIFLMILALMFILGTVENASAKSFENISENNQMILLDEEEEEVEEVEDVEEEDVEEEDGEEEDGEE